MAESDNAPTWRTNVFTWVGRTLRSALLFSSQGPRSIAVRVLRPVAAVLLVLAIDPQLLPVGPPYKPDGHSAKSLQIALNRALCGKGSNLSVRYPLHSKSYL